MSEQQGELPVPDQDETSAAAEEEAARLKAEEEARLKAEEAARLKAEEAARLKAEEAARLKAEEAARLKAEEEARLKVEEEARLKVEEEARRQEAARVQREAEVHRKQEEARRKAEEEARIKREMEEAETQRKAEIERRRQEEARIEEERRIAENTHVNNLIDTVQHVYPASSFPILMKVLKMIRFKGSVKRETMRHLIDYPEAMLDDALMTARTLFLVDAGDEYRLSPPGDALIDASVQEQLDLLGKALLSKEFVKDILFKIQIADGSSLPVEELDKTFYMLMKDRPEPEQKKAVQSFIDLCSTANIINVIQKKGSSRIEITAGGKDTLQKCTREKYHLVRHFNSLPPSSKHANAPGKESVLGTIPVTGACKDCGKPVNDGFIMCAYCGKMLKATCKGCGKDIDPAFKLCPWCGVPNPA